MKVFFFRHIYSKKHVYYDALKYLFKNSRYDLLSGWGLKCKQNQGFNFEVFFIQIKKENKMRPNWCTLVQFSTIPSAFISSWFTHEIHEGLQLAALKEDAFLQLLCKFESSMLIALKIPARILCAKNDKMKAKEIQQNRPSVQHSLLAGHTLMRIAALTPRAKKEAVVYVVRVMII